MAQLRPAAPSSLGRVRASPAAVGVAAVVDVGMGVHPWCFTRADLRHRRRVRRPIVGTRWCIVVLGGFLMLARRGGAASGV